MTRMASKGAILGPALVAVPSLHANPAVAQFLQTGGGGPGQVGPNFDGEDLIGEFPQDRAW